MSLLRIPLTYEVFHFLTGETLVSAVKIYFTPPNPTKEKFKLLAGEKPKTTTTFTAKTTFKTFFTIRHGESYQGLPGDGESV